MDQTKYQHVGGRHGYILRRLIHLATVIIPIVYYFPQFTSRTTQIINTTLTLFTLLVLILEIVRLNHAWIVVGQREYEKTHLSGFAWSCLGITLILLLAPKTGNYGAAYGLPLIWCFAIIDPLLGEARYHHLHVLFVALIGWVVSTFVWLLSFWWLGTPGPLALFIPIITVAAEMIKFNYLDDNIMVLVVPLLSALLYHSLF